MLRQMGKPLAGVLLGLGKGQNVRPVGVGSIIGRADRLIPASMLRAVVAGDPSSALGALTITHCQPFRNRTPVRLPSLFEPQASRAGIQFCILKRPCHLHLLSSTPYGKRTAYM